MARKSDLNENLLMIFNWGRMFEWYVQSLMLVEVWRGIRRALNGSHGFIRHRGLKIDFSPLCIRLQANTSMYTLKYRVPRVSHSYGNTGRGVFKRRVQNYKGFCLKNILTGNYSILRMGASDVFKNQMF